MGQPVKNLKILFVMRSKIYLRNFESVIRALAEAGHRLDITVSADERKVPDAINDLAQELEDRYRHVWFGTTLERSDFWTKFVEDIRALRNYLRYLAPAYASADLLRERAEKRLPAPAAFCARRGLFRSKAITRFCESLTRLIERSIPADRRIVAQLCQERPDILLVTPLVDLDSEQVDWVKAARKARIASGLCVASWDNLTNKGLIQIAPDRVMVWNEYQKQEAVEMHGIAAPAVSVTGAQLYDHWFEREPSRDRATFCRELGLDPEKPILLYCGSSIFISRFEPDFVTRWVKTIRGADDSRVAGANILVRPHPMHQVPYDDLDLSEHGRVAIHPRRGGLPVSDDAKADYFDALYHCAAVVGINTSALIEASILGKRCFTVNDETNRRTQDGTLHYKYLTKGGVVRQAANLAVHLADLSAELSPATQAAGAEGDDIRGFVGSFLRPLGLDRPATPALAAAILEVAEARPEKPPATDWMLLPLRWLCAPLALFLGFISMKHDWAFNLVVRVLRRGLIVVANLRRKDLVDLVSRPMLLDYAPKEVTILATSRQEFVTRSRSVMKEPWTVHWIEHCMKPGELLFDVGANIGTYALLCACIHAQRVKVFAFEPSFANYNALCRNILHNRFTGSITPVPIALFSESATTSFKYRSVDPGSAMHGMGDKAIEVKKQKEVRPQYEQTIFTLSLDEMVATYQIAVPNHIKIDVDGVELAILVGARETLANPRVKTVMVELGEPAEREAIIAALAESGLKLVREFDKQNSLGSSDAFFARQPEELAAALATAPEKPERES